ncbi:hypothetical protein Tco_0737603 [Tanacetum coccineum]
MGENVYIRDLIDFDVTMSTSRGIHLEWFVKYSANVEDCSSYINVSESAQDRDVGLGEAELCQKGVYEERFSRHDA